MQFQEIGALARVGSLSWCAPEIELWLDKGSHDDRLAPHARGDPNAGLGTVDDVCLASRHKRARSPLHTDRSDRGSRRRKMNGTP